MPGREVRYRDALWKIRADVERLQQLVTLSGRAALTADILAEIDRVLEMAAKLGEAEAENQRLKAEGLDSRDRLLIGEGLSLLQQLTADDAERVQRLQEVFGDGR